MWRIAILLVMACGGAAKPSSSVPANTAGEPANAPPVAAPARDFAEERQALAAIDEANPRSVDRAVRAADALGEARHGAAIEVLAAVAARPPAKKLIAAQVASVRAIGRMTGEKGRAAAALATLLERDVPARPRDREEEAAYALHLAIVGATVNAIGELEAGGGAATSLLAVMLRTPELTQQVRRALATGGATAAGEARKVLRGEHAAIEALIRARKLDAYCGDRGERPANRCEPVAARDFYAALVLGDLRDASAVPDLLAALERPALPVYYIEDIASPSTQQHAIFDALRKIGSPEAAAKLRALWSSAKTPVAVRTLAAAAYPFVVRDRAGADELWKIAADNAADDGLRMEAAAAFARLAGDKQNIAVFLQLARKYTDAAAKKRAAADKQLATKQAADLALDQAKDAAEAAKQKLLATTRDQVTTAEQIRAATEVAKRAEASLKAAKAKHRTQTAGYRQNDTAAKSYVAYARMFQTHVARVELASRCGEDVDCYAGALTTTAGDAVLRTKPFIADVETWSEDEKQGLVDAYGDRAMLELGKRAATAKLDAVLAALANENQVARETILLALPRLAPSPCPACIAKLDAAIEAGASKPYLAGVQLETQIVRNVLRSR